MATRKENKCKNGGISIFIKLLELVNLRRVGCGFLAFQRPVPALPDMNSAAGVDGHFRKLASWLRERRLGNCSIWVSVAVVFLSCGDSFILC